LLRCGPLSVVKRYALSILIDTWHDTSCRRAEVSDREPDSIATIACQLGLHKAHDINLHKQWSGWINGNDVESVVMDAEYELGMRMIEKDCRGICLWRNNGAAYLPISQIPQ
jgi:hypothetical protein